MNRPAFEFRNYLTKKEASNPRKQHEYDRFNLFMGLIGDIPFKILFTTKMSELYKILEKNMLNQQQTSLKWHKALALQTAGKNLIKTSRNKTLAEVLAITKKENPKLDIAIKKIRKLGIFIPPLQQDGNLRHKHFRMVAIAGVITVLGNFTPRRLFETHKSDLSELERGALIQAKMMDILASSGCGDPGPQPNGMACLPYGETFRCQPSPDLGANCVNFQGSCSAAGTDGNVTYETL